MEDEVINTQEFTTKKNPPLRFKFEVLMSSRVRLSITRIDTNETQEYMLSTYDIEDLYLAAGNANYESDMIND